MKLILSLALLMSASICFAGFEGINGSTSIGVFNRISCGPSINCTKATRGIFAIEASDIQNRVLATATTITAAECGSTFYNAGAIQMELPEASTVLGCRVTFITGNASNFDVNPDDADSILLLTNAAGDAIRNATLGNSLTLEASSASEWTQIAIIGTYTDIN